MTGVGGQGPYEPYRGQQPYPSGQQNGSPNPYQAYPVPPPQPLRQRPPRPMPPQQQPFTPPPPQQPFIPPPPPQAPQPQPQGGPGVGSVLWALTPMLTCGFGSPFTMLFAAVKRRSAWLGLASAAYAMAIALWIVIVDSYDSEDIPVGPGLLMFAGFLGSWAGATVHSFIIRRQVFGVPGASANDQAVAYAQHRRALREQARELAERDPSMARELRIGRPDLPRQYDDGGLVDVNHAPARVIADLPGMTPALAEQVVKVRETVDSFVSAEDLSAAASLPPNLTPELAEYTIYLP
ncbi:ComEA family DNA-binding protein [Sphaerimonospora cavernae]|uniref:ComEA family DNA-binding protein n=1 Tax=Sphaerimonospora cavernae TaxID=1740611 RepID=A0ABV6U8Z3_9ACTN